jgi:uncharacterized protein with PIN domain
MTERLLLDAMLGTLTTHLRMCGYDAAYVLEADVEDDDAILALARAEERRLVTRDRELATRVENGLIVDSRAIDDQLAELAAAGFDLSLPETPTRCSDCNGRLEAVGAEERTPEYAPAATERPVWRCRDCGQHFWTGSHWDDVADRLAGIGAE